MTVRQLWTQGTEYNAVDDRLALAALLPPGTHGEYGSAVGVRHADDLVPTLTTNTHVTVTRGIAAVELGGSIYLVGSDDAEELDVAPSDPTNARLDRIVVQAFDAEAGGADSPPTVRVLAGDPAASPVLPPLTDGMLLLADVSVPAGAGTPVLTDRRVFVSAGRPIAGMSSNSVAIKHNIATGIAAYQLTSIPVRGFTYAAGVLTVLRTGVYRWAGTAYFVAVTAPPSHVRLVTLYVNGATVPSYAGRTDIVLPASSRTSTIISGGGLIPLKAGDKCQLVVMQSSTLDIQVAAFFTMMMEDAGAGRDADTRAASEGIDDPDAWWTDLPFEQGPTEQDQVEYAPGEGPE